MGKKNFFSRFVNYLLQCKKVAQTLTAEYRLPKTDQQILPITRIICHDLRRLWIVSWDQRMRAGFVYPKHVTGCKFCKSLGQQLDCKERLKRDWLCSNLPRTSAHASYELQKGSFYNSSNEGICVAILPRLDVLPVCICLISAFISALY